MRNLLFLLFAAGCDPFGRWPEGYAEIDDVLWDTDVVAAADGIYAILPHATRHAPLRVRLWVEHLKERYADPGFWRRG